MDCREYPGRDSHRRDSVLSRSALPDITETGISSLSLPFLHWPIGVEPAFSEVIRHCVRSDVQMGEGTIWRTIRK